MEQFESMTRPTGGVGVLVQDTGVPPLSVAETGVMGAPFVKFAVGLAKLMVGATSFTAIEITSEEDPPVFEAVMV